MIADLCNSSPYSTLPEPSHTASLVRRRYVRMWARRVRFWYNLSLAARATQLRMQFYRCGTGSRRSVLTSYFVLLRTPLVFYRRFDQRPNSCTGSGLYNQRRPLPCLSVSEGAPTRIPAPSLSSPSSSRSSNGILCIPAQIQTCSLGYRHLWPLRAAVQSASPPAASRTQWVSAMWASEVRIIMPNSNFSDEDKYRPPAPYVCDSGGARRPSQTSPALCSAVHLAWRTVAVSMRVDLVFDELTSPAHVRPSFCAA
ncbi:hypothetical protein C2E23DRAFT_574206 [Lenzites betulinus]|nr:hypothetical protein C2E23DRAFT_574206 [Lenzites betulinus]